MLFLGIFFKCKKNKYIYVYQEAIEELIWILRLLGLNWIFFLKNKNSLEYASLMQFTYNSPGCLAKTE